ncbi:hypothetical protein LMG26842_04363 [Achromobacter dolens]|uniref:Wzz/FepE/Etk N-terminal domain-containing protein n=1 Tax=Achromobacter dolens TaxID=1287738 RepID=UPI0014686CB1|nr:Wzz/FepE/Etk N-terminal domain-containing protein [Achromobacter dolens]CAB3881096.1 hypothetical protein LMG26842_04363 [Achromobacter dolens]
MKTEQGSVDSDAEVGFVDVLKFFWNHRIIVCVFAVLGLLGAAGYLAVATSKYQASALIEMAQYGVYKGSSSAQSAIKPETVVESLRQPSTYSPKDLEACGLDPSPAGAELLVDLVKVSLPRGLTTMVTIDVIRNSPEVALACATRLYEITASRQAAMSSVQEAPLRERLASLQGQEKEVREYLKKVENTEFYQAAYLAQRDRLFNILHDIDEVTYLLTQFNPAKLAAPVYVSSRPVSPKKPLTLVLGLVAGAALGVAVALLRALRRPKA